MDEKEAEKKRSLRNEKLSPDTDDYEKQRLATPKRLKRGEVDLDWRRWSLANSLGWP